MTQENEPLKPPKETSSGPDPGISEEKSEDLDVDEDGTISDALDAFDEEKKDYEDYGDKPILKTAAEMAATEAVHGWTDPWKRRCTTS